jgi:LacI family transcriptional regulator
MVEPKHSGSPRGFQPNILLAFDWFDDRIYRGIAQFAADAGWHLSPYLFSDRHIPFNWPGDGAITSYGPTLGPFIESLGMPVVDITISEIPRQIPRVLNDNEEIGRLAAEHFLKRGFHHFAYFSWSSVPVNVVRQKSYRSALEDAGVPPENIHAILQPSDKILRDWPAHEAAILGQIDNLPRPLAVFTGQDNLGATLIEVCIRNGIHVPEEIAVLGVDNIEFLCDSLAVPLSSIDTRFADLGYQAARQLQRLLDGEIAPDEPPLLLASGGVVNRRSTEFLAIPHPAVAKALRMMRADFGSPMTLEHICRIVGMSKRGLEKAFRKHLQHSPAAELRRIRIDHAKRTLTETDMKVEAIARQCGYCNSSNLSLAFKRDTGLSPRAYRKKFRAEGETPKR